MNQLGFGESTPFKLLGHHFVCFVSLKKSTFALFTICANYGDMDKKIQCSLSCLGGEESQGAWKLVTEGLPTQENVNTGEWNVTYIIAA